MAVETVPETSKAYCEMTDLNPAALDAAVLAYDARRCEAHGDKPMSERNRESIRPMIAAAIRAYLQAMPRKAVKTDEPANYTEKALLALAQAYDREDAAQRGEPDPWMLDDPGDIGDSDTWVSERLACAEVAARAFLDAIGNANGVW